MPSSFVYESRPRLACRREAALNWLALGLLLAAWNTSDDDAGGTARRRPEVLRHYDLVSVRAANRVNAKSWRTNPCKGHKSVNES